MQIFYPTFAMFALTALVVFRLAFMRRAAVKAREVNFRYYLAYQGYEEPQRLRVASRHVINLFEAPQLFYLGILIIYVTGVTSPLLIGLAWTYFILRAVHSYVHLTNNVVIVRFQVFALSWIVLVAMWATLAGKVVQAAGA